MMQKITLTGQTGSETAEVEEVHRVVEQKPREQELEPTNKKPGPSGPYRKTSRKNVSGKKLRLKACILFLSSFVQVKEHASSEICIAI